MIPAADRWGPFADGIEAAEQRAADLCRLLAAVETDPAALEQASYALNGLAGRDRRHVLASYAALHRSA